MKHFYLGRLRFWILNNWLVSVPQSRLSVLSPSSILLEKLAFEQPEYSRQVKKETTFTSSLSCMSGFGQFSLNAWIGGEHLSRIWSDSMPGFSNVRSSVAFNCVVLPVLGGIPARVERGRERWRRELVKSVPVVELVVASVNPRRATANNTFYIFSSLEYFETAKTYS